MAKIKWELSRKDAVQVRAIADRALEFYGAVGIEDTHQDIRMDITACHLNGTRLDLDKFLTADDANFGHDMLGIRKYIDRNTGKLTKCFLPRCAR